MAGIELQRVLEIAQNHYGLEAKATPLEGYADENFMLQTTIGEKFLLKITSGQAAEELDFQVKLLTHLSDKNLPFATAKVIPNRNGNALTPLAPRKIALLLSWIPGRLWANVNPKSENLRKSLGTCAGMLTNALKDFEHPCGFRDLDWDLSKAAWTQRYSNTFRLARKEMVVFFQEAFAAIQNTYSILPKGIVHNDLNDYNILVSPETRNPSVVGIIDFGDAMHTQTINDLAVLLAYSCMDLPNPLAAACEVVAGYHAHYPLSEKELECLYTLVGMRLVVSVTHASLKKREFPTEEYFIISEKPAWELLEKWYKLDRNFALYSFRAACGFSPHPAEKDFKEWANKNRISLKTLFPTQEAEVVANLDMSVGSTLLGTASEYDDVELAGFKLKIFRRENPHALLINGYGECRPFYSTDAFKREGNNGPEYRTVHLGSDFWVDAGTPIHVPFDATVKIVHHNNLNKDYGPMIILEHQMDVGVFYTLYGHLSLSSLSAVKLGQNLKQGELLAEVGNAAENGNWPPHLHFQLILDLMDNDENFDGVAFPSESHIWKSICPDPNFIFEENLQPQTRDRSIEHLIDFRKEHLGKSLSLSYDRPLHIERGEGVYLIDYEGQKYLDTVNNVNHVGHQHPKVVKAGQGQMAVLNTNTRYLHSEIVKYAETLLKKLPSHLSVIHIVNSGSEANELALRMAKTVTGREHMIAIEVGYHGNTNAAMDVSSYKFDAVGGSGSPATTHILPLPDSFRGRYCGTNAGKKYADHAREIIESLAKEGKEIAGFIGETLISCGGQIVPPSNYFREVYHHVKKAGGVCIADEVQTGFGRMGKSFWAFELYGIAPDIVTMGKPAGNGHPLAVVACTREIAERFNTGLEYFNTFGGNPVSCAIGNAVLQVLEEENLQQNAEAVGSFLKEGLKKLKTEFNCVGDVRGEGLFLGLELTDGQKKPLANKASYLMNRMKEMGILMSIDGPDHNVMKIKPPLVFSMANAKELLSRLRQVFQEDFMRE